jgi:SagB-type dehydrogenase family enzyme
MLDAGDTRSLALLFHLNSMPRLDAADVDERMPGAAEHGTADAGDAIALPRLHGPNALLDLIRRRRSCRVFRPDPLALTDLAVLLAGTYGTSGPVTVEAGVEFEARTVPSAGGLFPLEIYVALERVDTLDDGLYRYRPLDHALEPVQAGFDRRALTAALLDAQYLEHANAIVFVAAVFDRTLHKYGARGYRFILLEAGHAAQNLCLLAADRGLATICVGGFVDSAVNALLGVKPRREGAVYCVGVGHASVG